MEIPIEMIRLLRVSLQSTIDCGQKAMEQLDRCGPILNNAVMTLQALERQHDEANQKEKSLDIDDQEK